MRSRRKKRSDTQRCIDRLREHGFDSRRMSPPTKRLVERITAPNSSRGQQGTSQS